MNEMNRLDVGGTAINRRKPLQFSFDGKTYSGFEGDTLASALLANGVVLMGRSFKYHRPRGCLTAGSSEPNAIVELRDGARREANTRATTIELYDGLVAQSQNRFPSLRFDLQSINQLFSPFLTAGFYYKTFMWPPSFWELVYEKLIRNAAGLGRASNDPDPDRYEHAHAHCDVLIVGGGAAGIAAARGAAATGARVILAEEQAVMGGMTAPKKDTIDGTPAGRWQKNMLAELAALDNVTIMPRTVVFGYYDGNVLAALERVSDHLPVPPPHMPRQKLWAIRAKQVVLACGSQERPLVFADNDRPGVILSGAARTFIERYGVLVGRKVAIATNNDDAYDTADALLDGGAEVPVILDARPSYSVRANELMARGVRVFTDALPLRAHGRLAVKALSTQSTDGDFIEKIECDAIAVSGGFSPDVHLSSQTGALPQWDESIQGFVPSKSIWAEVSAGAGNGVFDLADCLTDGHEKGLAAAEAAGFTAKKITQPLAAPAIPYSITPIWQCPMKKGKAFVDFQNDVTAQDITLAEQEGYVSVEHLKRYTTLGMATDQGKTSNLNGLAILAAARGEDIAAVGTTRFRPPYSPVAIGAFAGHECGKEFQPIRRTAMHECSVKLGGVFVEAGLWLRPQFYPKAGESISQTIYRESKQVRETAGICDVSSLGKIEIFGDDAAEFLNRIYINGWKTLAAGRARYGVMLREDGLVFDDGTTSCLGEGHYFMTTTTAKAAEVLSHLDYAAQVLWPELDVHFCSATEQWCGVAVAGPQSRNILAKAFGDAIDMSDAALPFMGVRDFDWLGTRARIFRISFSGELAYEVNVPWSSGEAIWDTIWAAGQDDGLIPYGVEALNVMRIEKGHVTGAEIDGRLTATDMGFAKMLSSKKPFVGRVMAGRSALIAQDRPQLVGLMLAEGEQGHFRSGAHIVPDKDNASSDTDIGWVTSVAHSPALGGRRIGLAFVKGGLSVHRGKHLYAVNPLFDEAHKVEVCSPHFFDPKGERLNG